MRLDFKLCVFTGFAATVEYIALAIYLISKTTVPVGEQFLLEPVYYIAKGAILLLTGVIAGIVTMQIKRWVGSALESIEDRDKIVGVFGQHVSPIVVNKLLSQKTQKKEATSEVRHVCMMFLDIRNFTHFSEKKDPADVVAYLNSLFEFMIEIINDNHGIVNKFLGDGFMAVFGAPFSDGQDSLHAVTAAYKIIERVEAESVAGRIPFTRVGIGLHAGLAVTGNVGSALRKEYTVIGDVVNLASRIEQLNKQFHSQLLISETVWQAIEQPDKQVTALGPVQVKGRDTPVEIYQLA